MDYKLSGYVLLVMLDLLNGLAFICEAYHLPSLEKKLSTSVPSIAVFLLTIHQHSSGENLMQTCSNIHELRYPDGTCDAAGIAQLLVLI